MTFLRLKLSVNELSHCPYWCRGRRRTTSSRPGALPLSALGRVKRGDVAEIRLRVRGGPPLVPIPLAPRFFGFRFPRVAHGDPGIFCSATPARGVPLLHNILFTAHDGGHLAITSTFTTDTLIAMFVADFCCGRSIGWWKSSHNVHHLFPRVPRHNLRKAQVLTQKFCEETGIPYSILGFVHRNKKVLDRLQEVGDQGRILLSCQRYMAETGESGLH